MSVLDSGHIILHYQIERPLAFGDLGEVYLATDVKLERPVAIKLLPAEVSGDPDARQRFIHEAKAASRLNHPNILTVYSNEEVDGQDIIVMEYVVGQTLAELIEGNRLSFSRIVEITSQICRGLETAHAAGIVHRDIKPANIIIGTDGRVRIMDFGVAVMATGSERSDGKLFAGTMAYASPEQWQDLPLDGRSDIWSVGVVLYEMIAGHRPFEEENSAALAYAVVHAPAPTIMAPIEDTPRQLSEIVGKCLSKEPSDRFQDVRSLREELEQTLAQSDYVGVADVRPTVAVLPFENLSGDPDQLHLCDGMSEEIFNALMRIEGMRVIAPVTREVVQREIDPIRSIGRSLNVDNLISGSLRRSGGQMRIAAKVWRTSTGTLIWSSQFDCQLTDLFDVQNQIAERIATALRVVLKERVTEELADVPTSNMQAYEYYLKGRRYLNQRRRQSLQFARQMFHRSVAADPDYALAHASAADCCSLLIHFYGDTSDATIEEADAASLRALELAPNLASAHSARGFALWVMNRPDEADSAFETAMRIDGRHFDSRYYYGRFCFQSGRMEKASHLFAEACAIRDEHEAWYFTAQTLTALNRPDESRNAYRNALQSVKRFVDLNPDDARAMTMGAVSHCRLGNRREGLIWAERALAIDPRDAGIQYNVACLFALEHERHRALQCLKAAVEAGFAHRDWVENDPDLDSLKDDPRFRALPWRTTSKSSSETSG